MPRIDNEIRITSSVVDRLLDYEPEQSREPPSSRSKSLRQLKESVKRDLEWLLNTRRVADELPADLTEVTNSLATYGFPDFTTVIVKSPADHLSRAIEATIRLFEPRLDAITVTPNAERKDDPPSRALCFRINARLKVEPAPEPVTFDTQLQLHSGEYVVQEA